MKLNRLEVNSERLGGIVEKLPKEEMDRFKKFWLGLDCLDKESEQRVRDSVALYAFEESEHDGDAGGALTKLKDGTWAAFEEAQDYTGHGCQCHSSSSVHSSKKDAINLGLGRELCDVLGIPFPI